MESMIGQIDLAARHLLSSSAENVDHLRQARSLFETGLVKVAVQSATEDDIASLEQIVQTMRERIKRKDFVVADMAFHKEIARISGNPIYIAISQAILEWMADYREEMLHFKTREKTLEEHERILACIRARDAAGAEDAMHEHLALA